MLVAYVGTDEVLVDTAENEGKLIEEFFTKGHRALCDYNRQETNEAFWITTRVYVG